MVKESRKIFVTVIEKVKISLFQILVLLLYPRTSGSYLCKIDNIVKGQSYGVETETIMYGQETINALDIGKKLG